MRPKRKIDSRQAAIAAIALMAGCAALRCGAMVGFDADYDAAMARAKERGKPLFALFTGSDWCVWCKRLDAEVFSKPEFLDVATNAYELAVLDFPMDDSRQSAAERKRNEKLSERFKVKGYPTVLLIDAKDGTELYRAGYERGGAKAWIESFQEGAELPEDFTCPLCKHGREDFEHVLPDTTPKQKGYICKICGHFEPCEGELPADYTCPLCKHTREDFEPAEQ